MLGRALFTFFIISYFLRFTSRYSWLGNFRFEMLLGVVILICILQGPDRDKWRQSISVSKRLYYFVLYVIVSLPLVTWPGSVLRFHLEEWFKVLMFFVFVVALVRTTQHLKWIFFVFMGTQIVRILEPLYLHVTTGYWGSAAYSHVGASMTELLRLSGAPDDVVNPNQLAWVIVNMVPFVYYLLWKEGKFGKVLSLLSAPFFIYCLLLTGSRSGLLSLAFVLLTIVFFSKNRTKNLLIALAIALPVAMFAFGGIGSSMQTRYLSLFENNVAGSDTAHRRVDSLLRGISSISNNPLFGNGLGTSKETNYNIFGGRANLTHDLYLETFQEVGLIGFIFLMSYILAIFKSLKEARRLLIEQGRSENDWLYRMITATQAWVVMDLFYSLSCFGLRSWEWYFFGGVATVCLALVREQVGAPGIIDTIRVG